ncbi:MAG: hypothetical protein VKK05_07530 [Synechococcus sp.]|nr:hypothetical protein [Synechococcus sp.]
MQPPRPLPHRRWIGALAGLALALPLLGAPPARAAEASPAQLQALEAALNGEANLEGLLESGPGLDPQLVDLQRRALLASFPDARWRLSPGSTLRDGRKTVQLQVSGSRQEGPTRYRLQATQQLLLSSNGQRINGQTVLREQALLRSGEAELPVILQIPDAVLTGQRYDVDVLVDEPLNGALLAGGITAITGQQRISLTSPGIELGALGGGGLFKTVQAPFNPGEQTWAVLLVHPQGVVSATKRVRVVTDKAQLQL